MEAWPLHGDPGSLERMWLGIGESTMTEIRPSPSPSTVRGERGRQSVGGASSHVVSIAM